MKLKNSKELREGCVLEGGTAEAFETGDWRSRRPVWHSDICIQCLRCWIHCPDSSITVAEGKITGIDYKHCKGCGICAKECPTKPKKAIEMVPERV
jgi:pyruvate ferredoxin oxidoreductase delta subunit